MESKQTHARSHIRRRSVSPAWWWRWSRFTTGWWVDGPAISSISKCNNRRRGSGCRCTDHRYVNVCRPWGHHSTTQPLPSTRGKPKKEVSHPHTHTCSITCITSFFCWPTVLRLRWCVMVKYKKTRFLLFRVNKWISILRDLHLTNKSDFCY